MNKENTDNELVKDKNKFYSFLFCSMYFIPIIAGYINEILSLREGTTISNYTYVVIYLLAFYVYFIVFGQNFRRVFSVLVVVLFTFLFQSLLYPEVNSVFKLSGGVVEIAKSTFFQFIVLSLSILFMSLCLSRGSMEWIKHYCEIYAYIVIVVYIITMILQFGAKNTSVYMTIAYEAMPAILIMMYMAFSEKKKSALYLFIICVAFIFIGGSRGALLQLCAATAIFFFLNEEPILSPKKFALLMIGIVAIFVIYFNFNNVLTTIQRFLEAHNFSSRTIRMLLGSSGEGGIFHFEDRLEVYRITINTLSVAGSGIFIYPKGTYYPHNIVLEFLLGYGYIIGTILFIALLIVVLRSYHYIKRDGNQFALLLWVSAFTTIFVKLMLSASYLTDRSFWFYLSIMIYAIRTEREQINDKKLS